MYWFSIFTFVCVCYLLTFHFISQKQSECLRWKSSTNKDPRWPNFPSAFHKREFNVFNLFYTSLDSSSLLINSQFTSLSLYIRSCWWLWWKLGHFVYSGLMASSSYSSCFLICIFQNFLNLTFKLMLIVSYFKLIKKSSFLYCFFLHWILVSSVLVSNKDVCFCSLNKLQTLFPSASLIWLTLDLILYDNALFFPLFD